MPHILCSECVKIILQKNKKKPVLRVLYFNIKDSEVFFFWKIVHRVQEERAPLGAPWGGTTKELS